MKSCELCKCMARIYCESDQASLCWTCDANVHSANFLVSRHLRSLLCHSCQSPTPWSASGEKLGRTVTLCIGCVDGCDILKEGKRERTDESRGGNDDDFESETEYDSDEDDDDDEDRLDEEDDGENQVVPWSSTSPPPAASSSESEEFSTGDTHVLSSKRSHENDADLSSKYDFSCSTSRRNNQLITSETAAARCIRGGEDAFVDSLYLRPLKMRIFDANRAAGVQHTLGTETIERFHEQDMTSSGKKASEAVDLDLSECP